VIQPVAFFAGGADASQAGKTYRQKLLAAVYNQNLSVVTKQAGGMGSMEETFSDHLVKGKVFIQFDNVRKGVRSASGNGNCDDLQCSI
jgi:hypothetical protein